MKQESIQLNTKRRGTFIKYFTTFSGQTTDDGAISYLIVDATNKPLKIVDSLIDTKIKRNEENNFVPYVGINNYSGTTVKQTSEFLNEIQKKSISEQYVTAINKQFEFNNTNHNKPVSFVEFIDCEVDDMYINISIKRTIDSLDTLSVYNVPINPFPLLEAKTGILFGKLEAIQSLTNENGEKIKIPLKNTPVAIFSPSSEFPNVGVNNDQDNRITLNLKENINIGTYFNIQSEKADLKYLTDTSQFSTIPDKYKYTAVTNEKGEFIIYGVPIGEQTFMYEINLLKHGLTIDEVALNLDRQYPTEDSPNVDKIPHYFFRQFPVNIVPTWGDFQSGYTQLNISIPIELRKWGVFLLSPIAYKEKSIEEMRASGTNSKITCAIRDMTKKLEEDRPNIEVVEVADIYSRNFEQVTEWSGEFKQLKNKVEFFNTAFNVFKVPANLYDPEGINSNGEKGVWLCAYQFKMFYSDENNIYRATGYEREFINNFGAIGRTHFNLNRNAEYGILTTQPQGKIGVFPYEKPWSLTYPEPYSIPKPPVAYNPNKKYDTDFAVTEPVFLDGDKAGDYYNQTPSKFTTINSVHGYGLQNIGDVPNANQFSREVTKNAVYKYERDVSWHDQYSNGYQPTFPNSFSKYGTVSKVLNGERWQRIEAGFAYWLRPEGWPRVTNYAWGDYLIDSDYIPPTNYGPFPPPGFSPPHYSGNITRIRENILLRLDTGTGLLKTGSLDVYKITNPDNLIKPLPPPLEKFVIVDFQRMFISGTRYDDGPTFASIGTNNHNQFNRMNGGTVYITNLGTTKITLTVGSTQKEILPNEQVSFYQEMNDGSKIVFPANNRYDTETNSYTTAKYSILLEAIINDNTHGGEYSPGTGDVCAGGRIDMLGDPQTNYGLPADTEDKIPTYYLAQVLPAVVRIDNFLYSSYFPPKSFAINGFAYETWGHNFVYATSDWVSSYFPTPAGAPMLNPITFLLKAPLPKTGVVGGNFPYSII